MEFATTRSLRTNKTAMQHLEDDYRWAYGLAYSPGSAEVKGVKPRTRSRQSP